MPYGPEFSLNHLITVNAGASGTTTPMVGDVLDMTGWDGVIYLAFKNTTDAAAALWNKQGTASGSLTDTSGLVTFTKKLVYLDVWRPTMQFVQGSYLASTSGDPKVLISIQYGGKILPTTQPASTTGLREYSPATSTATSS